MSNLLVGLLQRLRDLFFGPPTPPPMIPITLRPRVMVVIHNPLIEAEGGRRLTQVLGWNDPDQLAAAYLADLAEASHGLVEPRIVERIEQTEWPLKQDGFRYDDGFVQLFRAGGPFHQPDRVDYAAFLERFDVLNKVRHNLIDEVWWFAFPHAGLYESTMGGRGAFRCNSPPLPNTRSCPRRFVVMGFNCERGVGEMFENLGHRAEDILRHVHRRTSGTENLFERFCLYDKIAPGQANCGTVHFAPNSETDYDWDNPRPVASNCDDWLDNFPNFTGQTRQVTGADWGSGDIRQHHLWWLRRFPHVAGTLYGISNNWWNYVADPNTVR